MTRPDYGRVGRSRRSGSAAWQWIIIGGVLGMGCSAVFVLTLLTFGILSLDEPVEATSVAFQATDVPQPTADVAATVAVVVAETFAAMPSPTVPPTQEEQPTQEQQQPAIIVPTATNLPTQPPAGQPTAEPTTDTEQQTSQDSTNATDTGIAPRLDVVKGNMVRVDGGTFTMGTTPQEVAEAARQCTQRDDGSCLAEWGEDSSPTHNVTLNPFFIEDTEVTNAMYVEFLNAMGPNSHVNGCGGFKCVETRSTNEGSVIQFDSLNYDIGSSIFAGHPVVGVTWYGAKAYCEAIGRRLPTEAEWEFAARGTDGRVYPWPDELGWSTDYARTSRPVDLGVGVVEIQSYAQNLSPFGAWDMAGNAAEWVNDWYGANFYSQPASSGLNPTGPASGSDKAIRGGSWDTPPFFARSVHRQNARPDTTALWLGFRCASDFDESAVLPETNVQPTSSLGAFDTPVPDQPATEAPVDAAPTLPPLIPASPVANPTDVPSVPPGG